MRLVLRKIISWTFFLWMLSTLCLGKISVAGVTIDKRVANFYEVYKVKSISNEKIVPDTFPLPGLLSNEVTITACPGEYVPATFVIRANEEIRSLTIIPSDCRCKQSIIPAKAIDIRVVKCWFQAGIKVEETKKRILTPELLLKDDKLVLADLEERQNYLRIIGHSGVKLPSLKQAYLLISGPDSQNLKDIQPRDAETLQPVDIAVGTNKQFWITVKVPENARPGQYQGKINLKAVNAPPAEIVLRLRVLPFILERPCLRFSIYYTGQLTFDGKGSIGSLWKTPQQYYAEMVNLRAHGIDYPTIYQQDEQLFRQELELRKRAGLPAGPLFILGVQTGNPTKPDQLEALKTKVKTWITVAKRFGYSDCYFYGIDEAGGDRLKSQRSAWEAVHAAGGKIFVACDMKVFDLMGDLLDLAVQKGIPDSQEATKYHKIAHKIFCYYNPQVGVEEPETYRRNFGLLLWKAGYDGAMNFAYQYGMGHIWNDFDQKQYRDLVFAYPTINGVIDTIQWEGQREGVNDIRYLTTLLTYIQNAKPEKKVLAEEARNWVDKMDPHGDLDVLRERIIDWILLLE